MKHLYKGTITADVITRDYKGNDRDTKIIFNDAIIELETEGVCTNNMSYEQLLKNTATISKWSSITFEFKE